MGRHPAGLAVPPGAGARDHNGPVAGAGGADGDLAGAVLALDVDGVVLDPGRGGRGPWSRELEDRFGIRPAALAETFFGPRWPDIVVGRSPVEPALASALRTMGSDADPEAVLDCWFSADFVVNDEMVAAAREWHRRGARLVLATNQEHRRAAYLADRLRPLLPFEAMVWSADLGHTKAEPAFFELAAARIGAGPSPVVLLDDDPSNVAVARQAGWRAVRFAQGSPWRTDVEAALRAGR